MTFMHKHIMAEISITKTKNGKINFKIYKKFIQRISKEVAKAIAEEIYYENLFLKYLPEIRVIEEGKLKAKRDKEALKYLYKLSK